MNGKIILLASGLCLALAVRPARARCQDEQPTAEQAPVFEMGNERPPVFEMENQRPASPEPQPAPAAAQETAPPATPPPPRPRRLALGVGLLSEHALVSAVARVRYDHVALDAAYGINPVLVSYQEPESDAPGFGAEVSWVHVDGSLVLFFGGDQERFVNGLRFGAVFDQIVSFGGMLGWVGELGFQRFALGFGAGLKVYPRYEQRARERFDIDDDVEFPIPLWLNIYFGVTLRWYLM